MRCRNCDTEMLIDHAGIVTEGDNSPDTSTRVYHVPYCICPRADCPAHGVLTEGERVLLYDAAQPPAIPQRMKFDGEPHA